MGKTITAEEALEFAREAIKHGTLQEFDLTAMAHWVVSVLGEKATPPLRVNRGEHGSVVLSAHHPKMDGSHVKAMMTVYGARRLATDLLLAADAADAKGGTDGEA